jgi:hypothetical protein
MGIFNRKKNNAPLDATSETANENEIEYTFEVVGESFQRDHLVQLVKKHKAIEVGEIYTTAVLELEPTNDFDPTAVKVLVEGMQVGYIPKSLSGTATEHIKGLGKTSLEVPARLGWDTDNPQPLIGVMLALDIF